MYTNTLPQATVRDFDLEELLNSVVSSASSEVEQAAGQAAESAGQQAGQWATELFGGGSNPEGGGQTAGPGMPTTPTTQEVVMPPGTQQGTAIDNVVLNVNPMIGAGLVGGTAYMIAKRPIVAAASGLLAGALLHFRKQQLVNTQY